MANSEGSHSWVWTTGAAAVIAGALFGQHVVVQVPAPDAPEVGAAVQVPRSAAGREGPGAAGRTDAARPARAPAAGVVSVAPPYAGPAPARAPEPARPAAADAAEGTVPLLLREAASLPWQLPERVGGAAGSSLAELNRRTGVEERACNLLRTAYVLAVTGRTSAAGSGGCLVAEIR